MQKLFKFLNLAEIDDLRKLNILTDKSFGRYNKDLTKSEITRINKKFRVIIDDLDYI